MIIWHCKKRLKKYFLLDFDAASTCKFYFYGDFMELQTISQVSKQFRISTRTLRYYEQIGLIQSTMKEDYSYRTYDESTVLRLKQIIVLRKLRIPLKSIAKILLTENTALAIEIFQQNLSEIEDEITALDTIKSVIQSFIERLNSKNTKLQLLDDESLLEIVDSLTTTKINFKEDKTMEEKKKKKKKLNKLTDKDVRIIYLPPATVAAIRHIGGEPGPETISGRMLHQFIKDSNLAKIKPDFRHYGFNSTPEGAAPDGSDHGYERWVTIPDDMEVSPPFIKKQFAGGLYAAYMIPLGDFHNWDLFYDGWAKDHEKYEVAWGAPENMHGFLEEHLNYINLYHLPDDEEFDKKLQLDLLIPIKKR
jgi:DNA-binding transcriptional MerR regulator/DNA gyrase inhibitor GyrI